MPSREILPEEAAERHAQGQALVVDVRTLREWRSLRIPGSIHLPLDEIPARYEELDEDAELLLICAHGIRSAAATRWLEEAGFTRVANIRHGLCRWPGPLEHG
jgi:rhodanese-related sulfurtransferase